MDRHPVVHNDAVEFDVRIAKTRNRLRFSASLTCLALATAMLYPGSVAAQSANNPYSKIIQPQVAGAKGLPVPPADTPVAPQYQASYQVYLNMKKAAHGGTAYTRKTFWKMPDWSGMWTHANGFAWDPQLANPTANLIGVEAAKAMLAHCPDFPCKGWMTADLTPEYKLKFRQKLTAVAHGFEWDQLSDCLPAGYPRFLLDPFLREFVVKPDQTWMSQETEGEFRRVYTDGRGHVPDSDAHPLWEGDSIGFWDGDTLVVHTIRMKPAELQRNQPSISDEASTVERIRMVDPNTIEDDATLWDPKALKTPWRGVQKFTRVVSPGARLDMWSCEENNNVIQTANGGSTFILPGETVTVQRPYRDPENIQNVALDKAIAYGAKLMKEEAEKSGGHAKAAKTNPAND